MIFNALDSCCQVQLIDYHYHADGKYTFVLVNQDYVPTFVILDFGRSRLYQQGGIFTFGWNTYGFAI